MGTQNGHNVPFLKSAFNSQSVILTVKKSKCNSYNASYYSCNIYSLFPARFLGPSNTSILHTNLTLICGNNVSNSHEQEVSYLH